MTRPLITIRPEPGARETVARAAEMGLAMESWPLAEVRPLEWQAPDAVKFNGLLLGSANAVHHARGQLRQLAGLPVYAVGEHTAEVARAAGLQVVRTGPGSLQPLLDLLAGQRLTLLRLTGEKHVTVEPPEGIGITTVSIYTVEHLPVPAALAEWLEGGATVLLHSGEAAAHFAAECGRLSLRRNRIAVAALAPRVAAAAGEGWQAIAVAEVPQDEALLRTASTLAKRH